mmetsp:Transcript_12932/g.14851  ORF Transcript_12932/g.14851 Transcript_12932/m.14851 type:complete len:146 (+) Transcript_12932:1313-1750(+)
MNGKYHFYDGKTGEYKSEYENFACSYTKFISSNEMIGTCYSNETGKSKIMKYNVSKNEESEVATLDKYYYTININSDGRACSMEHDNVFYYVDLKSSDKTPIKLIEGYEYIRINSIYRDNISILYVEESKYFFALYNKAKLIFRK